MENLRRQEDLQSEDTSAREAGEEGMVQAEEEEDDAPPELII
jgi:hypothetical protein